MSSADTLVRPAHLWVPEHVSTYGPEVVGLAHEIGLPLDPEQELALDAINAIGADGKLAALEAAIVAPRQNIKTHVFKAQAWGDLLLFDQPLVVWSAHEFNTAMEAFLDMEHLVEGSPLISRRVKKINHANGDEGIEFMSGQRLRFKARTKGGGRGLTAPRLFMDEWFAGQATHLGSLLPTMAAMSMTGDPQVRYGSSAGLIYSEMLRRLRDRGRPGGDPGLVWIEWCATERPCDAPNCDHRFGSVGCVLDDRALWQEANLALGRRISIEFVAAMRRSLPPEEFAREFLGWWDEPALGGGGIPADAWAACTNATATIDEPCTLGFDVAPGHMSGGIVTCGGALHVTAHQPGTGWIVPRLVELDAEHDVSAIGMDPTGPAGALIPDLEKAGFVIRGPKTPNGKLVLLDGRESAQACEAFLRDAVGHTLVHRGELALNAAVEGAGRRQVGDSWKWSRRDSAVDISPLVAATVARHLWATTREAKKPARLVSF